MKKLPSSKAPSCAVDKYIGTDFDHVVNVSQEMESVKEVAKVTESVIVAGSNIEAIKTVATNIGDVNNVSDNMEYVKDVAAGIEGLPVVSYIGSEPPAQPVEGATWYCTTDGRTYVWYKDTDSYQWVESSPQSPIEIDPSTADNIFALWKRSAAEAGLNLVVGSFEEGGVLTSSTDVLLHKEFKSIYGWSGVFPKVVNAGSTPTPLGSGGWIDRSDVTLRGELLDSALRMRDGLFALRDIVSVADFGAVGDGVTDDTAAINAALAYAGGKSLYFPSGVYLTNGGHSIPAGCCIYGDGRASALKSTSLVDGGVDAGFRLFDARNITGFIVRDLMMDLGGITAFPSAIRCMRIFNCSDYAVHGIKAITPGAFTASMQCHHFRVQDCDIKVQSTDSAAHHDGVIDQWYGSHDFQILDNTIDGGAIALYPILVTGTDSNNNPTTSYRFTISGNIVSNTNEVGVWVQGRSGTCFDFDVSGNTVDTVTDFYGIAITDSHDFRCRGNQTKNTGLNGIRFSTEGSGTIAAVNGVVEGNVVTNANVTLSVNTGDGAGISVTSNCSRLSLTGNVVNGTSHTYAIFLGASTSNIEVLGTNLAIGTLGTFFNTVVSNRIPGGGAYTPTLTLMTNVTAATPRVCKWERSGNNIRVTGRVEITPTVGSSTTTQLGISLPVPSNLQDTNQDLTGSATTAFNLSAAIFSDITNDRAQFQFTAPNTGNNIFYFSFIYTVLP